jgi:hypothetical protein
MHTKPFVLGAALLGTGALLLAQSGSNAAFEKIRAEGLQRSQAEVVFETLTTDIGPRLTASPAQKRASEYMRDRLVSYGLSNVHLEPWKFGRGWTLEHLTVEMIEPRYLPLIAYADAWSPATSGDIVAAPVYVGGRDADALRAMGGQLKGAIVICSDPDEFRSQGSPTAKRAHLPPELCGARTSVGRARDTATPPGDPAQRTARALREAQPGVVLKPSVGEYGTVFVTGRDGGAGAPPTITVAAEQCNMIVRMLDHKIPVKLRVSVQSRFYDSENGNAYNVIAELPGSDAAVRDEIVMIGGHLDSWHTGVGATDNADGATTMVEAMRILKASGLQPRRTIRVALWSGEEQGLLGSKAWVQQHLAGEANAAARQVRRTSTSTMAMAQSTASFCRSVRGASMFDAA